MTLFYQLSMAGSDVAADVTINGFPLHAGEVAGSLATVLNPFLIGKGNQLKFLFGHRGPAAQFQGALQTVKQGEVPTTVAAGDFALPAGGELVHTFDSETAAFAPVLQAAQPARPEDLLALALTIRDLLRDRDVKRLMRLFAPKLAGYATAFGAPTAMLEADIAGGLAEFFDSDLDFGAEDLSAMPWCDDKVFLLVRNDGRALMHKTQPEGVLSLHIYAAVLKDGPTIVA